jgi:hypothetical protein
MSETTMVHIGKFTMPRQAAIIWVTGWAASAFVLLGVLFAKSNMLRVASAVGALLLFAFFTYMAYLTHCTISGKCVTLAWILTVFGVIYAIYIVLTLGYVMTFMGRK